MGETYRLFGLLVRSEVPLPELHQADAEQIDVEVRLGAVPPFTDEKSGLTVHGDAALLVIPEVGRYLIEGGRTMIVAPAPGVSERNLRLFLLGSAFAAILHQRALLPLHANAITLGDGAVAFMGHSGAGKSTMAAWFHDRGVPILADDVCVVTFDAAGQALAHPGIPRLRLWREALEASGRAVDDHELSFDDMDKYNVFTQAGAATEPVALAAVYLLGRADAASITSLTGVQAVEALVANTYRGGYVPLMAETRRHLATCLQLVRSVPIFRADRLWGYEAFDAQARLIEDHARAVIRQRP